MIFLADQDFDLADQIDEYICTFEGAGDLTMDTFVMILFALIVVLICILFLCKILYDKYVKKSSATTDTTATVTSPLTKIAATPTATSNGTPVTRSSEPKEMGSKRDAIIKQLKGDMSKPLATAPRPINPNIRRRIARTSPGPEVAAKKKIITPPSNISGPDPVITQWAVFMFRWLYSDLVVVQKLLQDWIQTINTALMAHIEKHEVIIEIVRLLPETHVPNITNLSIEKTDQMNEVEMIFDIECSPVFHIKGFKSNNQKTDISHFKASVTKCKSRMNLIINYFSLRGEMKIEGYPEIKILLNPIGPLKNLGQDESKMIALTTELLISSIRQPSYPVDFSLYPTCPRIPGDEPEEVQFEYSPYTYHDNYRTYQEEMYTSPTLGNIPKKLLVKIIKAEGLLPAQEPYCVIEMDEPPQKNMSLPKPGSNPLWDESFLFELSNHSTELLFEVYDRSVGVQKFLGLGLVGIDELSSGPASTQILELQPRPYETENITGTLTIEFVFIEGAQVPVPAPRRTHMKQSFRMNGESNFAKDLLDSRNIETPFATSSPSASGTTTLTTTNITSNTSSRVNSPIKKSILSTKTQQMNNLLLKVPPPMDYNMNNKSTDNTLTFNTTNSSNNLTINITDQIPQKKSHNIFGTLKNKFSLSKSRSKSLEQPSYSPSSDNLKSNSSTLSRGVSFEDKKLFPTIRGIARKTSISESSAISNASGRTFLSEESTLILETINNNILRHYLVPIDVAARQKFRKKGVKLHVYNDHTFVAKHIKGGMLCHVCNKMFAYRPGKQGYECRDCFLQCHKPCHVRSPQACPNPKILSMQLLKWPFK